MRPSRCCRLERRPARDPRAEPRRRHPLRPRPAAVRLDRGLRVAARRLRRRLRADAWCWPRRRTAPRPSLPGKNVANPMAMILAGAAVLAYAGEEAQQAARAIREACLEAVADGVRTADLGGHAGTSEFTDEVIRRTRSKLEVWASSRLYEAAAAAGARPRANTSRKTARDLRVELRPGAALDLGQRLLMRQRAPVGPVARHRVERVRDRQHARLDRDLLARLAGGVAGAVPALVVVEHVRDRLAQRGDPQQDPRADLRVLPDLRRARRRRGRLPCGAPRRRPRACRCRAAARRPAATRSAPRSSRAARATASASTVTRVEWPRVYGSRASIARLSIDSIATKAKFQGSRLGSLFRVRGDFSARFRWPGRRAPSGRGAAAPEPVLDRPQQPVVRHRRCEPRARPDERARAPAPAPSDRAESDSSKMTKTALCRLAAPQQRRQEAREPGVPVETGQSCMSWHMSGMTSAKSGRRLAARSRESAASGTTFRSRAGSDEHAAEVEERNVTLDVAPAAGARPARPAAGPPRTPSR